MKEERYILSQNKPTFTIFSPYVNKDHWASFEDGKFHHSVHLLEIKPNLFDEFTFEERKKIEKILMHYTSNLHQVSSTRIRPLLKKYL
jgi:hypothetical protein